MTNNHNPEALLNSDGSGHPTEPVPSRSKEQKRVEHTHTPWPEYEKALTSGGYSPVFVDETMAGLRRSPLAADCPACQVDALAEAVGEDKEKAAPSEPEAASS